MAQTIDQDHMRFLQAVATPVPTEGVRQQALQALQGLEIPGRKWEEWKYTRVKDLVQRDYGAATGSISDLSEYLIPELNGDVLVFINGQFSAEHSRTGSNGDALQVGAIGELNDTLSGVYDSHLGELVADSNIFTAANTAYADQGVVMFVPNGKIAEQPIQILHLHTAAGEATASQHRNLFIVGKNASAKVVETFFSAGEGTSFHNQVDELQVLDNGELEYVKLQSENQQASAMGHSSAWLGRDSRFSIYTLTFGGDIVRNNLYLKLAGENVHAVLNGAYLLDGTQHVDNNTRVDHAVPNCVSDELYKGIIDDRATGVFSGYIHVYPDAQKTNAFQSSRNIILSENANMYTKPQLEIYADDVKCSHGATTGRIDDSALFYLRARGIPEKEARKIMIHAFTMETIENLSIEPVKNYIEQRIQTRY